ncbi:tripartite tricarboxylate transporter substrate binding protein [Aquabacterium sp.]|uniref:tripartite tricarboxylate transporter substrate binding protein n=1 Tax=Aquabacterium sp. TaxID=1872578 RepID=UPI002D071F15|nr:tripartite tricarboxylate transporter substrate binding protein [Aquabacterium sp.]HSW08112.1 tripartite tricarboxylate transporter substrate binding protein [Aquabacterium sp.]
MTPTRPSSTTRRRLIGAATASALLPGLLPRGQAAQATPTATAPIAGGKTLTLLVSYPPGGGADLIARLIAPRLAEALGQPVIVENRPGASGTIAAGHVARATPDGTTLLVDASSFAVNPALFAKLPYDPASAFVPLAVVAQFANVLVCTPGFEARSVADVVRLARAKPRQVAYASSGNGSAQHLAGALFEQLAKLELNHVPYRGGGPAMTDVMGGQVPLFFANVASSMGHIQAGKLRALAVTSRLRTRALPEVPTMEEAGVKGHEVLEWNPVLAPAGLAPAVKASLVAALRRVKDDAEVIGRVRTLGGDIFAGDELRAAAFLKQQQAQWTQLVRERGIQRD